MAKGIIIGKEVRSFTDKSSGEVKVSRNLYVAWDTPKRKDDSLTGQRVESVFVPFDIDDIECGMYCEFEYEIKASAKGNFAHLVDIIPIGTAEVKLCPPIL